MSRKSTVAKTAPEFIQLCRAWGFEEHRQGRGDHVILQRGDGKVTVRAVGEVDDYCAQTVTRMLGVTRVAFLRGPTPARFTTPSRRKVVRWLNKREGGVIIDTKGHAGSTIAIELGYVGSRGLQAFASLLKHMEDCGQVHREVRGKRTYAVELLPDGPGVRQMLAEEPELEPVVTEVAAEEPALEEPAPPLQQFTVEQVAEALFKLAAGIVESGSRERWETERAALQQRVGDLLEQNQTLREKVKRLDDQIFHDKTTIETGARYVQRLQSELSDVLREGGRTLNPRLVREIELALGRSVSRNGTR